jgi:hypothetical protein
MVGSPLFYFFVCVFPLFAGMPDRIVFPFIKATVFRGLPPLRKSTVSAYHTAFGLSTKEVVNVGGMPSVTASEPLALPLGELSP